MSQVIVLLNVFTAIVLHSYSTLKAEMLRFCCREKREQLDRFWGLSPESQDQNLVLPVLHVPSSLDGG